MVLGISELMDRDNGEDEEETARAFFGTEDAEEDSTSESESDSESDDILHPIAFSKVPIESGLDLDF